MAEMKYVPPRREVGEYEGKKVYEEYGKCLCVAGDWPYGTYTQSLNCQLCQGSGGRWRVVLNQQQERGSNP